MAWPKTDATHNHSNLGLPDKGRSIKEFVVCNSWNLEPSLALGCYQLSPYDSCEMKNYLKW